MDSDHNDSDHNDSARSRKVDTLLRAALTEFARAGLDGARVDAIAAAAQMNKRLLYHYVGDKEALFSACLDLARDQVLSEPLKAWPEEWRLICHAEAAGRGVDLGALKRQQGSPAQTASRLGLALLASLLPELAKDLSPPAGADLPKPRLKLRPDLRSTREPDDSGSG